MNLYLLLCVFLHNIINLLRNYAKKYKKYCILDLNTYV
jgi:hypothetical protein